MSGKWKVKTVDDYGKDLKMKKVWKIRTLREFKDFLNELANSSSFGLLFYMPLAQKFNELYNQLRWNYRFILAAGFVLGMVFGYSLKLLVGGF